LAQSTLRAILGEHTLEEILQQRDKINEKLQLVLDRDTDDWGIQVIAVEMKDIVLPVSMQRSLASQAEAERERKAKVKYF
jgi:regulator of protease activity HflC (stomatin/prohibitin superfamily)